MTNATVCKIAHCAELAISWKHGLRTPVEEIAFTARQKIKSLSQIFRYGQSIFCLPHRPRISDFFDLCLHWVSVVRAWKHKARGHPTYYVLKLNKLP